MNIEKEVNKFADKTYEEIEGVRKTYGQIPYLNSNFRVVLIRAYKAGETHIKTKAMRVVEGMKDKVIECCDFCEGSEKRGFPDGHTCTCDCGVPEKNKQIDDILSALDKEL